MEQRIEGRAKFKIIVFEEVDSCGYWAIIFLGDRLEGKIGKIRDEPAGIFVNPAAHDRRF